MKIYPYLTALLLSLFIAACDDPKPVIDNAFKAVDYWIENPTRTEHYWLQECKESAETKDPNCVVIHTYKTEGADAAHKTYKLTLREEVAQKLIAKNLPPLPNAEISAELAEKYQQIVATNYKKQQPLDEGIPLILPEEKIESITVTQNNGIIMIKMIPNLNHIRYYFVPTIKEHPLDKDNTSNAPIQWSCYIDKEYTDVLINLDCEDNLITPELQALLQENN